MYTKDDVLELCNDTGMGVLSCKQAFEYASKYEGVTPLGYLKAISLAVSTPGLTFHERCERFSK